MPSTTCPACGRSSPLSTVHRAGCPAAPDEADADPLDRALELARRELDMDLAFLGEVADGHEIIFRTSGDPAVFGLREGMSIPLGETICDRVLDGGLSGVLPDVRADTGLRGLTCGHVGAYIGVPLSAGAQRYMLCCLAGEARPSLHRGDLRFLQGLSATVASALQDG